MSRQEESEPPPGGSHRLEARGVSVRFGGLSAISDVSIWVDRREILGLIGPNGAGKTTLINVLSGFQSASQGQVRLEQNKTSGWSPERFRRRGVARTFQSGRLFRNLTVSENVEVPCINLGLGRRRAAEQARELLEWIGLGDKATSLAGTLTYTEERRLEISRALAGRPHYLLLDEPTAGMTGGECDELIDIFRAIPSVFGCGIVLIEHNMLVALGVSQRVHVLDGGKTIAVGTPDQVRSDARTISAYLGSTARGGRLDA